MNWNFDSRHGSQSSLCRRGLIGVFRYRKILNSTESEIHYINDRVINEN
ncbi:MAG: hypothetical protein AB7U98_08065 [Candidatus Nitrosocosmicus sp.]